MKQLRIALACSILLLAFGAARQASASTLLGMGRNADGEIGNGTASPQVRTPTAVDGLTTAVGMSIGRGHVLALLEDGSAMAWGANSTGQLGVGGTAGMDQCVALCSKVPLAISGLSGAVAVAAGGNHSLALLSNGTVVAWGENDSGELGTGSTSGPEQCGVVGCSRTPIAVPGLTDVVAIAAGPEHSVALLSNGTVMVWGENASGQAGDGGSTSGCFCIAKPTPVPGISGAMAVAAGSDHNLALLSNGTVMAWGRASEGQLGNGVVAPAVGCECLTPVSVSMLGNAVAVEAGGDHSMAVLANRTVAAWGDNLFGQLGNGVESTEGCFCIPTPVSASDLADVQAIAGGGNHSIGAQRAGGVSGWGANVDGELGIEALGATKPTAIGGLAGASAVAAGEDNSLVLIGPSQTLKVVLAGAGAGTVGAQGILCPISCEGRYPQGQVEVLRAEGSGRTGFAGFSGACRGIAPCQVKMSGDQTVVATFGRPKGTRITAAKIRKRTARFAYTAPGAITGFQCRLLRPAARGKRRAHKPRFSRCGARRTFKRLRPGRYTFEVRALDIIGPDAKPAKRRFAIRRS